jgi:hypothetical protein
MSVCERKLSFYVWKRVVHGKNVCKQRAWKKVVASNSSGVHGRMSITKPLDSCFK